MPTTVQRSPPEGELRPERHALEQLRDTLPHHHFVVPNWKGRPWTMWTPDRSSSARGDHPPNRHVPERVALLLEQVDDEHYFPRQERATFGSPRHAALGFEYVRRGPVDLTRELGRGRAPEHDHVGGRACLDEGRFQAAGEHEHAGEHEYDERHPADRDAVVRRRAQRLRQIYENGIRIMAAYPTVRRPTTIGMRTTTVCGDNRGGEPARRAARSPAPW